MEFTKDGSLFVPIARNLVESNFRRRDAERNHFL